MDDPDPFMLPRHTLSFGTYFAVLRWLDAVSQRLGLSSDKIVSHTMLDELDLRGLTVLVFCANVPHHLLGHQREIVTVHLELLEMTWC
jgi:hypothetical protein